MKTLDLNSFDFRSEDQNFRVTISWDKDMPSDFILSRAVNVHGIKAYELDSEQLEFAKKYHLPFKYTYYSLEDFRSFIALLEEYEELVIEAEALKLDWDFSKFDFKGLEKAISEEMERKSNKSDSKE